jgi:HEAT repeat protein
MAASGDGSKDRLTGHVDALEIDAFATRIRKTRDSSGYRALLHELASDRQRGMVIVSQLVGNRSAEVRYWAMNAARKAFDRDAVPLLLDLAGDRRLSMRDEAMAQLEAIDPELLRPLIPAIRRMFLRGNVLHGEGRAAMFRLARLGDTDSSALFRRFAAKQDPRHFVHRMPLVLAGYLDDPDSLVSRIRAHDHDWMFWLAEAAWILEVPDADDALVRGAQAPYDTECQAICTEAARALARKLANPSPAWDIETD